MTLIAGRPAFDIAIHHAHSMFVLEAEPTGVDDRMDAASLVRAMIARISTRVGLEAFHRDAARQIRAITGFDRVMIYGFEGSGDGVVIAEAVKAGHQEILIAELNHRVRNVLALIRGLISQTRGEEASVAGYVESLNGRVQALARAHDRYPAQPKPESGDGDFHG
jgi:hypothetical protein